MIVDDGEINLLAIELFMEASSIDRTNFRSFIDSKAALAFIEKSFERTCCQNYVRLVLTDIEMPELDGF